MTLPSSTPEQLGLDSARLRRLDDWLEQQVSQNRVAGASVLVARHGSTALFKSAGLARTTSDDASATPGMFGIDTSQLTIGEQAAVDELLRTINESDGTNIDELNRAAQRLAVLRGRANARRKGL